MADTGARWKERAARREANKEPDNLFIPTSSQSALSSRQPLRQAVGGRAGGRAGIISAASTSPKRATPLLIDMRV